MYKISIIVPVYNMAPYLEECFESLVHQTDENFEVVIIDDGSTDGSDTICHEYCKRHRNMRYHWQENSGLGAARNAGIKQAQGEFITFVDSDDYVATCYLALMRKAQVLTGADVVSARFASVDESGNFLDEQRNNIRQKVNFCHDERLSHAAQVLVAYASSIACCRLYRKSTIAENAIFFPDRLPHEDLFFTYKVLLLSKKNTAIDDAVYFYRQRGDSLSKTFSVAHIDSLYALWKDTDDFLRVRNAPEIFHVLANRRILLQLSNLITRLTVTGEHVRNYLVSSYRDREGDINRLIQQVESSVLGSSAVPKNVRNAFRSFAFDQGKAHASGSGAAHERNSTGMHIARDKGESMTDILFIPHKDYHVYTISLFLHSLNRLGVRSKILDVTGVYRDEGVRRKAQELGLDLVDFATICEGALRPSMLVAFNDWEPIVRSLFCAAHDAGILTAALVEGIQDYDDADTKRVREPYRTSDVVIIPGPHDRKYFRNPRQKIFVGGVPRIAELFRHSAKRSRSTNKTALINSNFSYGVLVEARDEWLRGAVGACQLAGFQPVISRHPADEGALYSELVTKDTFYSALEVADVTIQRFASGILEALAVGKFVIYYNPHKEKADKFKDAGGALFYTESERDLVEILSKLDEQRVNATAVRRFLHDHCFIGEGNLNDIIASHLRDGVAKANSSTIDFSRFLSNVEIVKRYTSNFKKKVPDLQRRFPAIYGSADLGKLDVAGLFRSIETTGEVSGTRQIAGHAAPVTRIPEPKAQQAAGRAYIIGNGPSLSGFDLKRLKGKACFGMNAAYRHWDRIGWYPTHYACLDEVLGLSHIDPIARLIANADVYGIKKLLLRHSLIEALGPLGRWPQVVDFDELREGDARFAREPLTTGSHTAIWAATLGFSPLILLGVDADYVEVVSGAERREGNVLEIVREGDNPNYFFDGYQRSGDRYHLPNVGGKSHVRSWRVAGDILAEIGAVAYNTSFKSQVDVFEFCNVEQAVAGGPIDPIPAFGVFRRRMQPLSLPIVEGAQAD